MTQQNNENTLVRPSRDSIRYTVYRQIQLEHPEYTREQLNRAVNEIVDLVEQVLEEHA